MTRFSDKFQKHCWEQTNNKVPSNILPIIQDLILNMTVRSK